MVLNCIPGLRLRDLLNYHLTLYSLIPAKWFQIQAPLTLESVESTWLILSSVPSSWNDSTGWANCSFLHISELSFPSATQAPAWNALLLLAQGLLCSEKPIFQVWKAASWVHLRSWSIKKALQSKHDASKHQCIHAAEAQPDLWS